MISIKRIKRILLSGVSFKVLPALIALGFVAGGAGNSFFAFALDWPSAEGILVSNFGLNEQGTAVQENTFRAGGPIYPSDVGELVFYQDSSNSASRFPSPLGAWTALDHGDNIIGIYSRFEDSKNDSITTIVERETIIARAGKSGWTDEEGFSFAFFDRKERRWINPSIVIPPLDDDRPPVIRQVELRGVSGVSINPAQTRNIAQGAYSVYVDAYDTISASGETLAPNRIICTVNGSEAEELKFEFTAAKNGKRMVYRNGLVPAERVYYSWPGYEAGNVRFSRGQATLVVEVRDIAENSRSVTYRLNIE
ncbi:MAG: hypothetical protein LBP29_08335 [Treponema sp.]|jgi:hypothetical protein|nr:hypothetical protein [Treponema sp.]